MAGTLVANTINTDTGVFSTNNAYTGMAKAWVQFSGISGTTINNSFNVSSVTRTGTGQYTVNFTTAMSNANYSVSANANGSGASTTITTIFGNGSGTYTAPTASSFTFVTSYNTNSGSTADANIACVSVFSS